MFIFLKNRHVYFIIGWLVALFVNTCSSYICELRWGMNTLVWSLTRQSGLESPIKRSPTVFYWMMTSWCYLPPPGFCFHVSFTRSGSGVPVPIQPDGRRLDAQPPTKCDATKGRWLCQSWVSIICIFLQKSKPPLSSSKNGTLVPVSCNSTSIPVSSSSQMYHLEI